MRYCVPLNLPSFPRAELQARGDLGFGLHGLQPDCLADRPVIAGPHQSTINP